MLVHFPVAFWTVTVCAQVATLAGLDEGAVEIAKLSNGAGLIMALPAMVAGLMDLRSVDRQSEAMRVASWHMMLMATAWACFLLSLLLPGASETAMSLRTAQLSATASAGAGFVLMSIGGWLGGRLVYELGVGGRGRIDITGR